jgi:aminoglycoside N3'-acetyltransferase
MPTFRDFVAAIRRFDIDRSLPVIVHASLGAFGDVHGGAETVLGSLLSSFNTVIMPAFTSAHLPASSACTVSPLLHLHPHPTLIDIHVVF